MFVFVNKTALAISFLITRMTCAAILTRRFIIEIRFKGLVRPLSVHDSLEWCFCCLFRVNGEFVSFGLLVRGNVEILDTPFTRRYKVALFNGHATILKIN